MSMRISVDRRDPGYAQFAALVSEGWRIRVLLDGVEIPGLVTADEGSGEVVLTRYTIQGEPVRVEDSTIYDRCYGKVEIKVDRPNDTRVLH